MSNTKKRISDLLNSKRKLILVAKISGALANLGLQTALAQGDPTAVNTIIEAFLIILLADFLRKIIAVILAVLG